MELGKRDTQHAVNGSLPRARGTQPKGAMPSMVDYWDYAIHLPSGAFSAVNTKVLFDADVSAYANRQGVMTIMNNTVLFSSSVVLSGNSDNPEAAMDIHNSSAVFGSSFVCNGSGQAAVVSYTSIYLVTMWQWRLLACSLLRRLIPWPCILFRQHAIHHGCIVCSQLRSPQRRH